MKIEDIIISLNEHIKAKRILYNIKDKGFLVIKKKYTDTLIKIYKKVEISLWYVDNKNNRHKVLAVERSERVLTNDKNDMYEGASKIMCTNIFDWIGSQDYHNVISGIYGKHNTNE